MVGAIWLLGGNPVLLAEVKRRELRGERWFGNPKVAKLPRRSRRTLRGFQLRYRTSPAL